MGLQYTCTHTMLNQRTTDACLWPQLFSQMSPVTLNHTRNVPNNRPVIQYVKCSHTTSSFQFLVIGQPNNGMPSCRIAGLYFCISMEHNPTQSTFVYGNLFMCEKLKQVREWYIILKSCNARSCNIMQGQAALRKVMQRHAESCKVTSCNVIQGKPHTSLVNFTLLS